MREGSCNREKEREQNDARQDVYFAGVEFVTVVKSI